MKTTQDKHVAVCMLLFFLSAVLSFAENIAKDDNGTLAELQQEASAGSAEAQANLGFMYQMGKGVPRDYGKAIEWYLIAAEQGDERWSA